MNDFDAILTMIDKIDRSIAEERRARLSVSVSDAIELAFREGFEQAQIIPYSGPPWEDVKRTLVNRVVRAVDAVEELRPEESRG